MESIPADWNFSNWQWLLLLKCIGLCVGDSIMKINIRAGIRQDRDPPDQGSGGEDWVRRVSSDQARGEPECREYLRGDKLRFPISLQLFQCIC